MLDQHQIDRFHADGYLIMRALIGGRELDLLRAAADAVVAEGVSGRGEEHSYALRADGSRLYFRSERMWDRDPIFRAATVHPHLLENIGQCVGRPFFPWNDSFVVKLPREGLAHGFHQDPPYNVGDARRGAVHPVPNFTTDIYLDRSTRDNGCVWAIPGHHLVGQVDLDRDQDALFAHPDAVAIEMEPGDVLFHCLSTPHGSRMNRSGDLRRTFYVHYLAQEIFLDAYTGYDWAANKPGWGAAKRDQLADMRAARVALGLDPVPSPHVVESPQGLAVQSCPTTPVNHWGSLAAAIPPARKDALRALSAAAAGKAARRAGLT